MQVRIPERKLACKVEEGILVCSFEGVPVCKRVCMVVVGMLVGMLEGMQVHMMAGSMADTVMAQGSMADKILAGSMAGMLAGSRVVRSKQADNRVGHSTWMSYSRYGCRNILPIGVLSRREEATRRKFLVVFSF
jgi:hypothetical protein